MDQHGSGMWDMTCPFCEFPLNGPTPNNDPKFAWLDQLVAISEKNPPVFGTYDGYGRVGNVDIAEDEDNIGLHKVCWEILGKPDYKWLIDHDLYTANEMWTNYISEYFDNYMDQFAEWNDFFQESDDVWAAYDPSQPAGEKNRQRLNERLESLGGPFSGSVAKQKKIVKQQFTYPKLISDCTKGPKQGGLAIKELRQLATSMGINVKGLKKADICNEIKKLLNL